MSEPLRLLLIEDSQDDADLILLQLRREGIAVMATRVQAREELEAALAEGAWEIVICDYNLPTFNARLALELVRQHELDIPFLVVSGAIGEETAAELMRMGAHDVIMKGHLTRLAPAVERELREAGIRREKRKTEIERIRLLDELKQAITLRDEFLTIASHELRTPLTPLNVQLHILHRASKRAGEGTLPAPLVASRIEAAERHIARLDKLIESLLDVSRIMNRKLVLHLQDTNLSEIVIDSIHRLSKQANGVGCELKLRVDPEVHGNWDRLRMDQIVSHLISNAIKYGAKHPIEIRLSADKDLATLMIRDYGIGISSVDQERIFHRFERAAGLDFAGLGLGLYLVRQLVESHGGSIHVESDPGKGAAFTVTLPRRPQTGESSIEHRKGA